MDRSAYRQTEFAQALDLDASMVVIDTTHQTTLCFDPGLDTDPNGKSEWLNTSPSPTTG